VAAGQTVNTHLITKNGIFYSYGEGDGSTWDGDRDDKGINVEVVSDDVFFHPDGETLKGENKRSVKMFYERTTQWGSHTIVFDCESN